MKDDWRLLRGQEEYLHGVELVYRTYTQVSPSNDHDHCEFCMDKFGLAPEHLHVGYCTTDNSIWVCNKCYDDFKNRFKWVILSTGDGSV